MGKKQLRLSVDAINHFAPLAGVSDLSALDAFRSAGEQSPLHRAIGRQDAAVPFVDDVVLQLQHQGIAVGAAEQLAAAVLAAPTIIMTGVDGRVLQSVLAHESEDELCVRVTLRARVLPADGNRAVSDVHVAAMPFDVDDRDELARVAADLAAEALDYPAPNPTGARRFTVGVMGKPQGVLQGAHPWNHLLNSLGRVLNLNFRIIVDQQSAKDSLPADTSDVFVLDSSFMGAALRVASSEQVRPVDCAGREFHEVCVEMAKVLLERISERAEAEPTPRARKLVAGERVFHRKEYSDGPFDRFGAPRKRCNHSLEGFKRYHKAPKAEKGMARLYTNFLPEMLYHCGKGYNCGTYAVFAPDDLA